ncbi:hypothetical protein OSB04_009638 [Centaurea solstitialis]|uniref:Reverse transcriptase domain-containing protein n=1 Tax=Centaurea solstitialis TaxID=347529 RepID=A0AA38T7N8_9ASTR|nr:hypothetical protein OSB04_009638 [Centaurea solstitialis]
MSRLISSFRSLGFATRSRTSSFRINALRLYYDNRQFSTNNNHPGPLTQYKNLVKEGQLQFDPYQEKVALELDNLLTRLKQYEKEMEEYHEKLAKWEEDRENERRRLLLKEAESKQNRSEAIEKTHNRFLGKWLDRKKPVNVDPGVGKWVSYLNRERKLDSAVGRRPSVPPAPKGLYIYGNVGSGKTMLMDMFYSSTKGIAMLDINERMHNVWKNQVHEKSMQSSLANWIMNLPFDTKVKEWVAAEESYKEEMQLKNILPAVADKFLVDQRSDRRGASILCFDEIQTVDVFAIVALSGIISRLLSTGTVLVATSNRAPSDLNQDGMQWEIFLKLLAKLEDHCETVLIGSETDYRRLISQRSINRVTYFYPLNAIAIRKFENMWDDIIGNFGGLVKSETISVMFGRTLEVPESCNGVAKFTFEYLCGRPVQFLDLFEFLHIICLCSVLVLLAAEGTYSSDKPTIQRCDLRMTKNANARIDDLENNVGTIKECVEKLMLEMAKITKQQDEANSRLDSGQSGEYDEVTGSGGSRKKTDTNGDQTRFLAVKGRKLEMPTFDGTDPDGWILRAERYFNLNRLSQTEKIEVAFISFEGTALKWFQWENRRHPILRWEDLRRLILRQFRSTAKGTLCEQFLAIKQEVYGSGLTVRRDPEEVFMSQFINGLDGLIRAEVRVLNPATLEEAMEIALKVEVKNAALIKERFSLGVKRTGSTYTGPKIASESTTTTNSPNSVTNPNNKSGQGYRRLTDQEVQQKRTLGLCYRCDEKYSPGHRCKKKELSILLVQADDTEGEVIGGEGEKALDTATVYEVDKEVEVHLNSVVGLTNPKTIKMEGAVDDQRVVILIDSGATHNFISTEIVEKKGLKVEKTNEYLITLGLGEKVKGMGVCRHVEVNVQGLEVIDDFLPIQLGNSDVILGMQWLETLGTTWVNWKEQVMKFTTAGRTVTLKGNPALGKSLVSLKAMSKIIQQQGQAILVELGSCLLSTEEERNPPAPLVIQAVIEEFDQIFNMPRELPPQRGKEHVINLKEGTEVVNVRPYRYPHYQKNEIEKLVKEMLEAKPFSSPVLLVKKKDGSWRFCIDYRALNKATVTDKFPIPIIDELLDELYGAKIFSKLDLKSGYHQIRMKEGDVYKTAFRTHQGHYEFMVMPFGLVNAPSTFQGLMNEIFKEYLRKFVLVFFDDILIYSPTMEEHVDHLRKVFQVLVCNQLYANRKKCEFAKERLGYLGHVISREGVEVDDSKIQTIRDWQIPKSVTELRGFLGLSGYYRKFVKGYGIIASPLTDLLKKDQFVWSEEAQTAFNRLKEVLSTAPVLKLPDFSAEFVIETDASGTGVGAVLMQNEQPIAYYSQVLGTRARQKSAYEKELMAVVFAVKKWRPYLLGNHFTVRSDQQSLKFLLEQRVVEPEYQHWMSKLMGYNFSIVYKPGSANKAADALSRKSEATELSNLSIPQWIEWEGFKEEIKGDAFLMKIKIDLEANEEAHKGFRIHHDLLYYKDRLVLPRKSTWVQKLFKEFHATPVGGHTGESRTYQRMASELFWVGMRKDISKMVSECEICQRNKVLSGSPAGLLQPLALPTMVWSDITMDFIEGLPKSGGWNSIMVVNCPLVGDQGIASLLSSASYSLTKVKLQTLNVGDLSLAVIGHYGIALTDLVLAGLPKVTEKGFWVMGNGRVTSFTKSALSLESVLLEECNRVTQCGVFSILVNCSNNLKSLTLESCYGIKDLALKFPFSRCNAFRSLSVRNCPGFGNNSLVLFGNLCPQLRNVEFTGAHGITDEGFTALVRCCEAGLIKVNLCGSASMTDNMVSEITKVHGGTLETLNLDGCRSVTNASLAAIASNCLNLTELDVSGCTITDSGISALACAIQLNLRILSVSRCRLVSDKSLPYFANLGVVGLNLQKCDGMSSRGVGRLADRLWHCDILS